MTILTSILQSIRNAASYNKHELAAPRVILWPDEERLWTHCIEPLRESYPALWSLRLLNSCINILRNFVFSLVCKGK